MKVKKFERQWAVVQYNLNLNYLEDPGYEEEVLFKGSLADCWAFIRLTVNGYMK